MNIEGWMKESELDWLAQQASVANLIFEIGVYKGRSTLHLCNHTNGHVVAVDWFKGDKSVPAVDLGEVVQNLQVPLNDGTLTLIVADVCKYDFDALFSVRPPDFAFIDGGHSYYQVMHDINLCKSIGAKTIAGHDYGHKDVRRAISNFSHRHVVEQIWELT